MAERGPQSRGPPPAGRTGLAWASLPWCSWNGTHASGEAVNLIGIPVLLREGKMLSQNAYPSSAGKQIRPLWVLSKICFHPAKAPVGCGAGAVRCGSSAEERARPAACSEQVPQVPTAPSSLGNTRELLSILFKYKALW